MVSPLNRAQASGEGMLITAVEVSNTAADSGQLVSMLEQAEEMTGERVPVTLADGGYHTAANLEAGERRSDVFVMPERYHSGVRALTSKTASSMMLPPTATLVPKASAFHLGVCTGTTARFRDPSEFIVPQEPFAGPALLMGSAPKTCTPGARCGSAPLMPYFGSTGSGWTQIRPGAGTPGVRCSANPPSAS